MNNKEVFRGNHSVDFKLLLTQRIKPAQEDYGQRLMDHHSVIIQAMKVKQSSSMDAAALLTSSIKSLSNIMSER